MPLVSIGKVLGVRSGCGAVTISSSIRRRRHERLLFGADNSSRWSASASAAGGESTWASALGLVTDLRVIVFDEEDLGCYPALGRRLQR